MKYHLLFMALWIRSGLFAVCYAILRHRKFRKTWKVVDSFSIKMDLTQELVSLVNHFSISEKLHLAENTVFVKSSRLPRQKITGRSSRPEMSVKKGFSKILLNLQENNRDSRFLIKFQAVGLQLYWKRLQHRRFPVAKFSGIRSKMNNVLGRLLLHRLNNQFLLHRVAHESLKYAWDLNLLFLIFFNIQYPLKVIVQCLVKFITRYLLKSHYGVPSLRKPLQVNSAIRALLTLAGHLVILKYILSCTIF